MSRLLLVAGSIASNYRNGGIAWERLSWALGLRRLGFDVVAVDQLDLARCVYDNGGGHGYEHCLNRAWFESVVGRFGLAGSSALIGDGGEHLAGRTLEELLELAGEAELLVNVAGNLRLDPLKRRARRTVYVDVDPGFTQLWLASGRPAPRLEGHDVHFTIGENVGTPGCLLPTSGIRWHHTRQPVLLDEWPYAVDDVPPRFTTVARWRGSGPHGRLEQIGLELEHKAEEFAKVIELPSRVPQLCEIALDTRSDDDPGGLLEGHGWQVVDAATVSSDPDSFRRYVQASWAEFSVAKGAYVETGSGWFSDRTTRYLASGRPALVQDTGFGRTLPVGEGLLGFRTLDDAVSGAFSIASDYERHRAAARRIAEEYFDSGRVLARFLEDAAS